MDRESMGEEKREYSRVETRPRARLSIPGGDELLCTDVMDVSLGGLLLNGDCDIDAGTDVLVTITLGEEADTQLIEALGKIVRFDDRGIAVEFTDLETLDSLEHLRKLVLYNSITPKSVEDEFRDHRGIAKNGVSM